MPIYENRVAEKAKKTTERANEIRTMNMDKDNSYEIPFGAKDSELKGWEYTIPEGYVARIDGNKIILEPKESDDERMIKSIIKSITDLSPACFEIYGVKKEDILAWLERQGSQNLDNSEKICKDEQNPAWSEEDNVRFTSTIQVLEFAHSLDSYNQYGKKDIRDNLTWLKSLKDRLLPQPKQEWSEEDIMRIDNLIAIIGNRGYPDYVEYLEKLKERYTWKPSDEQMKLLREVQQALLGKDCHNRFVNFMCDLKNLKG